jgi:hypothetical protein
MIVDDFHIRGAGCSAKPLETHTPLIVDPNAELPLPIAGEGFESIAGQNGEILQSSRRIQAIQFHSRLPFDAEKAVNFYTAGELSCSLVAIAYDQPR